MQIKETIGVSFLGSFESPPRVGDAAVPSSLAGTEIAYTPSPRGSVFHIVSPATAAPTS